MHAGNGNLFTRDDTFFGVCEGLGEDLRIPSNLFRVVFALGFFFSAQGAVIIYLALGVLVLLSRLVFPNPRAARSTVQAVEPSLRPEAAAAKASAHEETVQHELPIAA